MIDFSFLKNQLVNLEICLATKPDFSKSLGQIRLSENYSH